MFNHRKNHPCFLIGLGVMLGLLVGIGMMIGSWATISRMTPAFAFPETALYATGSDSSDSLAIATGPVDDDSEGLYTLDFITGELQCVVIYLRGPRAQKFGAIFKTNVIRDLGISQSKKPRFVMVTGQTRFLGGAGFRPGQSVVYVADANTGRFAAYGMPWQPTLASKGNPQAGALILLDTGQARMAAIRE